MLLIDLNGKWQMKRVDEIDWIDARVPGSVYNDLLEAGKMKDPFYRDNEYEILELSNYDYEYKRIFSVTPDVVRHDQVILLCEGLDTLSEVYINGENVLNSHNMHRTYEVDIKDVLSAGENEIHVILRSPVQYCLEKDKEEYLCSCADAVPGISHLRKGHSMFGWDWGPQLPDLGIWRSISIGGYDAARIDDVYITQLHGENKVSVDARIKLNHWSGTEKVILVQMESPDGEKTEKKIITDGSAEQHILLDVNNPRLWWPNNFGAQPLYKLEVALLNGSDRIDVKTYRIGLRTIKVRCEKDPWGESFEFVVNGKSIFSMGADFIPQDNLLPRCSREKTEKLIKSCVQANFNTIRVWGGGYYQEDYFYDLCDEYGLIVWQDHLYACGIYNFSEEFKENITHETVDNMKRIRHHASLGLWSGNNELELAWDEWQWAERFGEKLHQDYKKQFEEYLPELAKQMDPNTFYLIASPTSFGKAQFANDENYGDMHYWEVWHGRKPITEFRKIYPRFMSEFGLQSFPSLKTVESFTLPEDRNIFSYVMESHQKNGTGNEKILFYISENFKYPKDFDSLLYASQLIQAEGLRNGVEHWRRNRGRCMGALYWQLNDCWPVASWSSIDYFGRWKAAQYASKRFFAPVLASACEEGTSVELHVSNEKLEAFTGKLSWSLRNNRSEVIKSGGADVSVEELSTAGRISLDFSDILDSGEKLRSAYLEFALTSEGEEISGGVVLFVKAKHFSLLSPEISTMITDRGDRFEIMVKSSAFARFVELDLKDADAIFSDNIFDLSAGKLKKVEVRKENISRALTLEDIKERLMVRSLFDTFEL